MEHRAEDIEVKSRPSKYGLDSTDLLSGERKALWIDDIAAGLLDGAVKRPVSAITQSFGKEIKPSSEAEKSSAHKVGEIAGTVVPFIGVALATRGASSKLFGAAEPGLARLMAEQASAGLILGSALTPTDLKPGQNLLTARLHQGATDMAVFASMAGTNKYLTGKLGEANGTIAHVTQRLVVGAGAGSAAGFVDAELRSGFTASRNEVLTSMAGFALLGTAFEGGSMGLRALISRPSVNTGDSLKSQLAELNPRVKNGSITELLASDPQVTVISSPAGWYDKLVKAIRTAPEGQTIAVTEEKWAKEAALMLRSLKRPDVTIVLDKTAKAPTAAQAVPQEASRAGKADAASTAEVSTKDMPSWELSKWIRAEAERTGLKAEDAVVEALKRNRVVMIGEYHVAGSSHNEWGSQYLMPRLKGKATHLAIEEGSDLKLFKEGKLIFENLPDKHQHREYAELLRAANANGLKISQVDVPEGLSRSMLERNKYMDKQIAEILKDPEAKVVFWVGNQHLKTVDSGDGPQVVSLLRNRNIPTATFYGQHDNFWREEPMRRIFTPSIPLAVPTAESPYLRSMSHLHPDQPGHAVHKFREYDYVLMQPEKRAPHYD